MTAIVALLCLVTGLLIWQFVGYPLVMGLVASRSEPYNKRYTYVPFVSIIVPAYNEERAIRTRVENLLDLNYPKDRYEVIVVESGSTDATSNVMEETIAHHSSSGPQLKLIREQERRGKASAINLGKQHAEGSIVLVSDANAAFHADVLREMAPYFEDPKVGGVGGRRVVCNPDNRLTRSESFYWDLEHMMRSGESALDSACLFQGEINAWRRDLAEADVTNLSEDLDMTIQIRRVGYKIAYEPAAMVYESAATTAQDQVRQRKRTTIGTLQCIFKHRDYFLLPRDLYSMLIFPSHKGLTMLSPLLLLAIPILYLVAWDVGIVLAHLSLTLLVFLVLLGALLSVRTRLVKGAGQGTGVSVTALPGIFYYVLLNEYLVLLAWVDFILGRYSVLWQQAVTTRDLAKDHELRRV